MFGFILVATIGAIKVGFLCRVRCHDMHPKVSLLDLSCSTVCACSSAPPIQGVALHKSTNVARKFSKAMKLIKRLKKERQKINSNVVQQTFDLPVDGKLVLCPSL